MINFFQIKILNDSTPWVFMLVFRKFVRFENSCGYFFVTYLNERITKIWPEREFVQCQIMAIFVWFEVTPNCLLSRNFIESFAICPNTLCFQTWHFHIQSQIHFHFEYFKLVIDSTEVEWLLWLLIVWKEIDNSY